MPTISKLVVHPVAVHPDFTFPTHLTSLLLNVMCGSVDVAVLTSLTRLHKLHELTIDFTEGQTPLDLSEQTTVTGLNQNRPPVTRLPTSLVECNIVAQSDADLMDLTRLTTLTLTME